MFPGWVVSNPFGPNVGFVSVEVQFHLDYMIAIVVIQEHCQEEKVSCFLSLKEWNG